LYVVGGVVGGALSSVSSSSWSDTPGSSNY